MRLSISNLALRLALPAALAAGACAGDSPDQMIRQCTKQLYEKCITEHDCLNENCLPFPEGYMMCTQSCDAANPCPMLSDGTPVSCVASVCKPPSPVDCQVLE